VFFPSCFQKHGYLAGSDADRAEDINRAFADPSIEGVICIRGGYGAHRLMKLIDFDAIVAHPKFFSGYSDITALHLQFNQRCGFATWHTPTPGEEWYRGLNEYTLGCLKRALFGPFPEAVENPPGIPLKTLTGGQGEGTLVGGNLSLVTATLGTFYEIDTRGKVLFLEDVDEDPYSIDRMLLHLKHAGKFADCAGIILGEFTRCAAERPDQSLTFGEVFSELLGDEGKPILYNFQCGHSETTASIPLGYHAEIDGDERTIRFNR
jgi:muramoyltetrapeptide carboxypeptidase